MRKLLYLVLALVSLSVVASCIDRPDIVLDEEQMIDLLVDVHRAEGLLEMQQQQGAGFGSDLDTYQKEVIAAVLQKHGVSRSRYDSSLMWYAQHLKLLTRVYGHVDERLNEEHEMWSLQVTETRDFVNSIAGDSVDLWTLCDHLILDSRRYSDILFWEIPSDSNFVDGDTLRWRFIIRQLLPGQRVLASISLTKYEPTEEEQFDMRSFTEFVCSSEGLGDRQLLDVFVWQVQLFPDKVAIVLSYDMKGEPARIELPTGSHESAWLPKEPDDRTHAGDDRSAKSLSSRPIRVSSGVRVAFVRGMIVLEAVL